jgi:hypothetical protein
MEEMTLSLPVDLQERRELLEKELKNTVTGLISQKLTSKLKTLFQEFKLEGEIATISWEFHPESDDEGGTDWYPSYVTLEVDEETIEIEEVTVNKKSKYSSDFYDHQLDDEIHDMLYDWKEDLHKNNVEKITVKLGE